MEITSRDSVNLCPSSSPKLLHLPNVIPFQLFHLIGEYKTYSSIQYNLTSTPIDNSTESSYFHFIQETQLSQPEFPNTDTPGSYAGGAYSSGNTASNPRIPAHPPGKTSPANATSYNYLRATWLIELNSFPYSSPPPPKLLRALPSHPKVRWINFRSITIFTHK